MKKLLTGALLLTAISASAVVPDQLLSMPCRTEIEKFLKKQGSKDQWRRTVDPEEGVMAFSSPTDTIGRWVEIQTFENPHVYAYDAQKTVVREWGVKNCELVNSSDTKPMSILKGKNVFNDEKLKSVVESGKKSLIYVWSPTMVYSLQNMEVFKKMAKEMELEFIPVLDPNQNVENAQKVLSQFQPDLKAEKHRSLEILMREGAAHFPSSFLVHNGKISKRIFGAWTAEKLAPKLKEELIMLESEGH